MDYYNITTKGVFGIDNPSASETQLSVQEETLDVTCRSIIVEQTLPLRHSVLWPEKPLSHVLLSEDSKGLHMGAFVASRDLPVCIISLFIESLPKGIDVEYGQSGPSGAGLQARFRKFACDPLFQSRGIGSKLFRYCLSVARTDLGVTMVWCDARVTNQRWYMKRGMIPIGETFPKDSVEYVRMYIDVGDSVPVGYDHK